MDAATRARVRVIDLETAGNGPTDVCEIGWQDVERDASGLWHLSEQGGSVFVNPGRPISAETMAIHHILDDWVAEAGYWRDVAPGILRPETGAAALAAHRASFEQRYCTPQLSGAASWICTWKCALRLWPELPRFSNQMLRYLRRPAGLDHARGLPAHRAFPDAYVTAHHLRDMLNQASLEQLVAWSREPGLLPRVPNGPTRGTAWTDLGDTDLEAMANARDVDIRFSARHELERRGQAMPVPAGENPQPTLF